MVELVVSGEGACVCVCVCGSVSACVGICTVCGGIQRVDVWVGVCVRVAREREGRCNGEARDCRHGLRVGSRRRVAWRLVPRVRPSGHSPTHTLLSPSRTLSPVSAGLSPLPPNLQAAADAAGGKLHVTVGLALPGGGPAVAVSLAVAGGRVAAPAFRRELLPPGCLQALQYALEDGLPVVLEVARWVGVFGVGVVNRFLPGCLGSSSAGHIVTKHFR